MGGMGVGAYLRQDVELGQNREGDAVHDVDMRHDVPLKQSTLELVMRGTPHLAEGVPVHGDHIDERRDHDADGAKGRAGEEHGRGEVHQEAPHHNALDEELRDERRVAVPQHDPG